MSMVDPVLPPGGWMLVGVGIAIIGMLLGKLIAATVNERREARRWKENELDDRFKRIERRLDKLEPVSF